jgi:hypothetical protein
MDKLDQLDDASAAAAFRRLVRLLRHREDAQNIDLMGLAGFCRNCLSDWVGEAAGLSKAEAREVVYGEPYDVWKARQPEATPEQVRRMDESMAKNDALDRALDAALADSFPASDPPAMIQPK